ncbi:MAG TPA: cytochrome C oxidase subunit IV family protein [Candidatus Sulfotelmatobacter sp.]|nr:cytochrome C oxidase subunit IV family protein [Candidatus Sulfotelmatobacter sp.]
MANPHDTGKYITVFWWLLGITIFEVVVIFLPIARLLVGILLVGSALSKASLVAMFYMHLKFERRTLGMIVLTPLAICILLVFALLPDLSATPHRTTAASAPVAPPR